MKPVEQFIIDILLNVFTVDQLNAFFTDSRNTAFVVGSLVAISGALLGTFLLLRHMSMTSDAISHTVLLGIIGAFLVMTHVFRQDPDLSSPWLIMGAALSGVVTVFLTELINRSGLVREDAALGLAFPLLFAISIILISRYADDIHLDQDSVLVGEIGFAASRTNDYCYQNCEDVVITPDHPKAEVQRQCINCRPNGDYSPRDPEAEFIETCANCGTYDSFTAWQKRYITENERPIFVEWPRAITAIGLITLINLLFVTLLYKELKLATFDAALAATLGFRPGLFHYTLMALVSITAVGTFDAVGSILVIAFFVVPAATAYLLTDRLWLMLVISGGLGTISAYTGYDLASGHLLGIIDLDHMMQTINELLGREHIKWDTSISASMVIMTGFFFGLAWVFSPRYGLVSGVVRRFNQRRRFAEQMLLAHLINHQNKPESIEECNLDTLPDHLDWPPEHIQQVVRRLKLSQQIQVEGQQVRVTERGIKRAMEFIVPPSQ